MSIQIQSGPLPQPPEAQARAAHERADVQSVSRPAPQPVEAKVDEPEMMETVKKIAEHLESYMQSMGRSLEFRVDSSSGRTVVSVRVSQTGELIRQIPTEEVLKLAQAADPSSALVSLTA